MKKDSVYNVLREYAEPMTAHDVATVIGWDKGIVAAHLTHLENDGRAVKAGKVKNGSNRIVWQYRVADVVVPGLFPKYNHKVEHPEDFDLVDDVEETREDPLEEVLVLLRELSRAVRGICQQKAIVDTELRKLNSVRALLKD